MLVLLNSEYYLLTEIFLANFAQWNYGSSGNRAQARSLIAAIKESGFKFGIYSSPGVSYPIIIPLQNSKLMSKY